MTLDFSMVVEFGLARIGLAAASKSCPLLLGKCIH